MIIKKNLLKIIGLTIFMLTFFSYKVKAIDYTQVKKTSKTNSSNSFENTIWFDDGTYSGNLYKDGESFVSGGQAPYIISYNEPVTFRVKDFCVWNKYTYYMNFKYKTGWLPATKIITKEGYTFEVSLYSYSYHLDITKYAAPKFYLRGYSSYDGYTISEEEWIGNDNVNHGTEYHTATDYKTGSYSGECMTTDTRQYTQNYSGTVTLKQPSNPSIPPTVDEKGGKITFSPNTQIPWSNLGKSIGLPVSIKCDKPKISHKWVQHYKKIYTIDSWSSNKVGSSWDNPVHKITTYSQDLGVQFDVNYSIGDISVLGNCKPSLVSNGGTVYVGEGGNQSLSAVTAYAQKKDIPIAPKGDAPITNGDNHNGSRITCTIIVDKVDQLPPPINPAGNSGTYNIDYTKTNINVDNAKSNWINNPAPYPVTINVTDNLSGFDNNSRVTVTDYSHYGNNAEDRLPNGGLKYIKTVNLSDGIYKLTVEADDVATNENNDLFETYLIDGTKPIVNFSIPPGIFSEQNGAISKVSQEGNNLAFYGKITAKDNLSGVGKVQYAWGYGITTPSNYKIIYTSPYTYTDRYNETIEKEIEKPVGDNLYLHIQVWDIAGNLIEKAIGPFEDPIKLKNFQVTDVRDPNWKEVFWKDKDIKSFLDPIGKTFKANELPLNDKSHPSLKNASPKKGYAFYFDITSEFLYRDKDRIEIVPSFYYIKGNKRIPVDLYYDKDNNPLISLGSKEDDITLNMNTKKYGDVLIGGLSKLTLTKGVRITNGKEFLGTDGWKDKIQYTEGKEQWWYGKYYIPHSSVFVKRGNDPRPENILKDNKILVNFQIIAYKNGVETMSSDQIFNYVPDQWKLESGENTDYLEGDVVIYDNKYSTLSDHKTYIVQ